MKAFIQRYIDEIKYALGGGGLGFIGTRLWEDWVYPILITIVCALFSLIIGHFGKRAMNSWQYKKDVFKTKVKQNGEG
jgi:hypothetical protein